jgi:hypothetical protein
MCVCVCVCILRPSLPSTLTFSILLTCVCVCLCLGGSVAVGLPPTHKALLMAALLMIDYMYFETKKDNDNNN